MPMNEVIEFANHNPVTWFATVENGSPRVRGLWLWFADETGFYYHSGTMKSVLGQMEANPQVEAAFHNPGDGGLGQSRMLRVRGRVEFVEDRELENRLYEERSWLKDVRAAFPKQKIRIFKIAAGEAQFWDMSVNCREQEQPWISF